MKTFCVDFELSGHIEVKAKNEEEAKEKVGEMELKELADSIQNTKVGSNYCDEV